MHCRTDARPFWICLEKELQSDKEPASGNLGPPLTSCVIPLCGLLACVNTCSQVLQCQTHRARTSVPQPETLPRSSVLWAACYPSPLRVSSPLAKSTAAPGNSHVGVSLPELSLISVAPLSRTEPWRSCWTGRAQLTGQGGQGAVALEGERGVQWHS